MLSCMLHGRGGSLVTGIDHTPPVRPSELGIEAHCSHRTMLARRYFLPAVFLVIQLILISIISQAQGRWGPGSNCRKFEATI